METASTYFTRRARQERTSAADAPSAEARSAHLELAFRLVKVATEPAMWSGWSGGRAIACGPNGDHLDGVSGALRNAFPLHAAGTFDELLDALDRTHP